MTEAKKNRTAILSVSERGAKLGQRIKSLVAPHADCFEKENRPSGGEAIYFDSLKNHIGQIFKDYDQVLCIMALGIVVRMIAPYIEHKSKDPAVVVMDEVGHHVISLLSGHLGGANEWTQSISLAIDADPVITTATDVNGLPAPDVLARHEHLLVDDFQTLINVNSAIVGGECIDYYIDESLPNAAHLEQAAKAHIGEHGSVHVVSMEQLGETPCKNESAEEDSSRVVITDKVITEYVHQLILRPRTYTMGIGCRRGTPKELILDAIQQSLAAHKLSPKSLVTAASVIVKQDEVGLLEAMEIMGWSIVFYTQDEMAPLIEEEKLKESNFVKGTNRSRKRMRDNSITSGQEPNINTAQNNLSQNNGSHCTGNIKVIGIGPGDEEFMTPQAREAILAADRVVGYLTYLDLIKDLIEGKETVGTAMMQEVDRCQQAVDLAVEGHQVVVVSSGDSGVYGMAGLVLELANKVPAEKRPSVDIVPGLSAVNVAASVLGAPLMHDFAVISLSDLMTPWDLIKKRADLCAQGDMVISLYNPRSKKRVTHLDEVREIVLKYRDPKTPVGIVQKAGRPGQHMVISDLENFTNEEVDMQTLVIIGNSQTYVENGRMITPRGYKL